MEKGNFIWSKKNPIPLKENFQLSSNLSTRRKNLISNNHLAILRMRAKILTALSHLKIWTPSTKMNWKSLRCLVTKLSNNYFLNLRTVVKLKCRMNRKASSFYKTAPVLKMSKKKYLSQVRKSSNAKLIKSYTIRKIN